MAYLKGISDCIEGLEVTDRTYGDGYIQKVLKTRVKVKFKNRIGLVTYDIPHLKICLQHQENTRP